MRYNLQAHLFFVQIYFGVCVTICVTASWVGATHCIKYLYFYKPEIIKDTVTDNNSVTGLHQEHVRYRSHHSLCRSIIIQYSS